MDADLKFEIACRKLLLKRLQTPLNTLERARDKEAGKYNDRVTIISEYNTREEAHDAFGYGYITEDEYRHVCALFDTGEQIREGGITAAGAAIDMLLEFMGRLKREIRDFEWEALPEEERKRRSQATEKYKEELHARANGTFY